MTDTAPSTVTDEPEAGAADLVWEFHHRMSAKGVYLHTNATIGQLVPLAVSNGWTVPSLADECSRNLGADRDRWAGFVVSRLKRIAPTVPGAAPLGRSLPFCGDCQRGWIEDPETHFPVCRCPCRKVAA